MTCEGAAASFPSVACMPIFVVSGSDFARFMWAGPQNLASPYLNPNPKLQNWGLKSGPDLTPYHLPEAHVNSLDRP